MGVIASRGGRALVTGGAGFIGSNLVEALVFQGVDVRVVDNLSTGKRDNLALFEDKIEFILGDLCDLEAARCACESVDCVYHVAALSSVPLSEERPLETTRHGVTATVNVLTAAKDAGVRRVVYSSSSSIYGGEGPFPQEEDAPPTPKGSYAVSKLCGELYVRVFAEAFGLDGVSLRYFNVFGPRQPVQGYYSAVLPAFISRMLKGERPVVFGDGLQTRDFTYVSDIVSANVRAGGCGRCFKGEVVNVAAGRETNLLELVEFLNRILETDLEPVHGAERPGDTRRSLGDPSRAKELLGHVVEVGVEEGLRKTVDYFRSVKA